MTETHPITVSRRVTAFLRQEYVTNYDHIFSILSQYNDTEIIFINKNKQYLSRKHLAPPCSLGSITLISKCTFRVKNINHLFDIICMMPQIIMISVKYVSLVVYFEINESKVFVDVSIPYFNKAHSPRKIRRCLSAIDATVTT